MFNRGRKIWPWTLTAVLVTAAICAAVLAGSIESAAGMGSFVSGFASALAFIWLVAGYYQQWTELRLQRRELRLQRKALKLQRNELAKAAQHGALSQIDAMLRGFAASLPHRGLEVVGIELFPTVYMTAMEMWETILHSSDDEHVVAGYVKWLRLENTAVEFLGVLRLAAQLYEESADHLRLSQEHDPIAFVLENARSLSAVPHIQQYLGPALSLARFMQTTEPGRTRIRAKGMTATERLYPGTIDHRALVSLLEEVSKLDTELARKRSKDSEA